MEETIDSSLPLFKLQPLNLCKKKAKNQTKPLLISEVNVRNYIIAERCPITVLNSKSTYITSFWGKKTKTKTQ